MSRYLTDNDELKRLQQLLAEDTRRRTVPETKTFISLLYFGGIHKSSYVFMNFLK